MSDDDKFFRDMVYKMMGFGAVVLIAYFGWMLSMGDKEKFISPFLTDAKLIAKAEMEFTEGYEKCDICLKGLKEIKCSFQMRRDRGISLVCFFFGSLFWVWSIFWAHSRIQDHNQATVPKRKFIWTYCGLVISSQVIAMYLIFKDMG